MLQMTEMLASLMTRKAMKDEILSKLHQAFYLLLKEAQPESKSFILGSKASPGDQM